MRGIYRRDNLIVLSKTEMPAVLVEAGVIVKAPEIALADTQIRREAMAAQLNERLATAAQVR